MIFVCSSITWADSSESTQISPKYCKEGVNKQPGGPFALYIFCDDALATNVAVFLSDMHNPLRGPYLLTKRFWQNEEWSADVSDILWLSDGKHLLIATSPIYGTGEIYKLDLENRKYISIYKYTGESEVCAVHISEIDSNKISVNITDCDGKGNEFEISI